MFMVLKFKNYIKETTDNPISTSKIDVSNKAYYSEDAITFGYIPESEYYFDRQNIEEYEMISEERPNNPYYLIQLKKLKKYAKTHYDKIFYGYDTQITYDEYIDKISKLPTITEDVDEPLIIYVSKIGSEITHNVSYTREDFIYPGRLWVDAYYISFWKYPENNNKLLKIISDINKAYKIIFNYNLTLTNNINVELSYDWSKHNHKNDDLDDYVIKAKDYVKNSVKTNKTILNTPHNERDYKKRRQWYSDNEYKSKKSEWKKWMKPFENYIFNDLEYLFLENGFTENELNDIKETGYFNNIEYSNNKIKIYRSLSLPKHKVIVFYNNIDDIGEYWSLRSDLGPVWGRIAQDNLMFPKEEIIDIKCHSYIQANEIDWVMMRYAYDDDFHNFTDEKEIRIINFGKNIKDIKCENIKY